MRLYKYKQFKTLKPINENLDKAKKFLKEQEMLKKAAEDLGLITGELEQQLKHNEIRGLGLHHFDEKFHKDIFKKMKEHKPKPEELKKIQSNEDFLKLKELLKDNLGYLYNFTYFYFVENVDYNEIEDMYNKLIEYKGLLNQMPKQFDLNFIDLKINNNSEVLADQLQDLEDYQKVKKIIDQFPKKFKNYEGHTVDLRGEYKKASKVQKNKIKQIALGFEEVGDSLEEREKIWKLFFGEVKEVEEDGKTVKKYKGLLKRYKNLNEFIEAAENHLKSSSNADLVKFYDKIHEVNEKFGQLGTDKVFDKNNIVILDIKSFQANKVLNSHTSHCIADYSSHWDSYIGETNKQYYIYNFNLGSYDNKSVIGVTIDKTGNVSDHSYGDACHAKDDTQISKSGIKNLLKEWEKKYDLNKNIFDDVLKPLSKEEIERRERAKTANREIVKPDLSIEDIKTYVKRDGADINKDDGKPLENAVIEGDIEKVKFILDLGASPNLNTKSNIIEKTKDIEIIKLLVSKGAEMTSDGFKNIADKPEAVRFCLDHGLDLDSETGKPIRVIIVGDYRNIKNPGSAYMESMDIVLDYIQENDDIQNFDKIVKWAADYGRIDLIEKVVSLGIKTGFVIAYNWIGHSRRMDKEGKAKMGKYLKELALKYEPNEFEDLLGNKSKRKQVPKIQEITKDK